MTREEAIAAAKRYAATEGLTVGPVCDVRYFTGDEYFDCEVRPTVHWCVYFTSAGASWEELNEDQRGVLSRGYDEPTIVIVDDESAKTRLFWSL
jgi:hypothetical protein